MQTKASVEMLKFNIVPSAGGIAALCDVRALHAGQIPTVVVGSAAMVG